MLTNYLMSRYYDPVTRRFINADGYFKAGGHILDTNMSAYCRNNPVMFNDPSGSCAIAHSMGYYGPCPGVGKPGCMDNQFITSGGVPGLVGNITSTMDAGVDVLSHAASKFVKNSPKPSYIGAGIHNRMVNSQLAKISKFKLGASTVLNGVGKASNVASVAMDVGVGVYDNIQAGSAWDKVASDAVVDITFSASSIWLAGKAGSMIGTAVGIAAPGLGNAAGAVVGFAVGVAMYTIIDVIPINGKTVRTWAKEGVYSVC